MTVPSASGTQNNSGPGYSKNLYIILVISLIVITNVKVALVTIEAAAFHHHEPFLNYKVVSE